ncbi:hypothetical protein ASG90_19750 [Nocardioides sp. Soil797]|nr:hypothetical protein ASG90_19750 [Nocardioides sp. Soil797]
MTSLDQSRATNQRQELDMTTKPAYAIGYLRDVRVGAEIAEYLDRIDDTLAPFAGEFIIHGGTLTAMEGEWPGDVIIIRFPDQRAAREWYDSPAYQAILPLRTEHSDGIVAIVEGEAPGYRAAGKLERQSA